MATVIDLDMREYKNHGDPEPKPKRKQERSLLGWRLVSAPMGAFGEEAEQQRAKWEETKCLKSVLEQPPGSLLIPKKYRDLGEVFSDKECLPPHHLIDCAIEILLGVKLLKPKITL